MKNILFIHQSVELYGSDKTFLLLIKNLDTSQFFPIVVLPGEGPLKSELEALEVKVIVTPVLKLYRKIFSVKNIRRFLVDFKNANRFTNELIKTYRIDLVYSNTLAVLLGFFIARKFKIKHLWHIHEIIENPKIVTFFYKMLLNSKYTSKIIYNSKATANFWNTNSVNKPKTKVIWNGLDKFVDVEESTRDKIRKSYFHATNKTLILGIIGRISRLKGQMVFLETFQKLVQRIPHIKLIIIGSTPPEKDYYLTEVEQSIKTLHLENHVVILPYQKDIYQFWQSIDIALVPSVEKESFGLVALEAMLAKKPVVAFDHGGVAEIIEDQKTGFLIPLHNLTIFEDTVERLINNSDLRISMGEKGFNRAVSMFSTQRYSTEIEKLLTEILS